MLSLPQTYHPCIVSETAQTEKSQKLKPEKKLPKKLNIGAAEVGSTFR
jgi:hypothetical protein